MAPIRLVTFDMTGTLLKFKSPGMEQYARAAAQHGVRVEADKLTPHFKASWKRMAEHHPNFGLHSIGWEKWWTQIVNDTLHETRSTNEQRLRIAEHLIEHFATSNAWEVARNGFKVLESLKEKNQKLGVISNFDPRLHEIMNSLSLRKYFDFVVISYEAGFSKPDQRIFDMALRKANVVANEAVHVGNDENLDYKGAKSAGYHSFLVSEESDLENVIEYVRDLDT